MIPNISTSSILILNIRVEHEMCDEKRDFTFKATIGRLEKKKLNIAARSPSITIQFALYLNNRLAKFYPTLAHLNQLKYIFEVRMTRERSYEFKTISSLLDFFLFNTPLHPHISSLNDLQISTNIRSYRLLKRQQGKKKY